MHSVEFLLSELKAQSMLISESHIERFLMLRKQNPDKTLEYFADVIMGSFRKELATAATDIIHKSIIEGVDDKQKFIIGILEISKEATAELMSRIT